MSDGPTTVVYDLAIFFADSEGHCVTITSVTSSNELIATVAMVNGNLQVTPITQGTATVTIYAGSGSNPPDQQWVVKTFEIKVVAQGEATPLCGPSQGTLPDAFRVRKSDGQATVVYDLAVSFADSEGRCFTITSVTSSNTNIATAAIAGGDLQVTPLNPGTATVTIYASSGSNPPRAVKTIEITVIP